MKYCLFVIVNCGIVSALNLKTASNARILNYQSENTGDGHYYFKFESSDGIFREEEGHLIENTPDSPVVVKGSYSYTDDNGQFYKVVYTADQNGFRPVNHYTSSRQVLPRVENSILENTADIKPNNLVSTTILPISSTVPFSSTITPSLQLTENDNLSSIDLETKNNLDNLLYSEYLSTNRPQLSTADVLLLSTVNSKTDAPANIPFPLKTSSVTVTENNDFSSVDLQAKNNNQLESEQFLPIIKNAPKRPTNLILTSSLPLSSTVPLLTTIKPNFQLTEDNSLSSIDLQTKNILDNSNNFSTNRPNNQFSTTTLPLSSDGLFLSAVNLKTDAPARFQIPLKTSSVTVIENKDTASVDLIAKNNIVNFLNLDYSSTNSPRNQFSTTASPLSSEVAFSTTINPESDTSSTVQIPANTRFGNPSSLDSKVKNSIDSLFGAEQSISKEVNSL